MMTFTILHKIKDMGGVKTVLLAYAPCVRNGSLITHYGSPFLFFRRVGFFSFYPRLIDGNERLINGVCCKQTVYLRLGIADREAVPSVAVNGPGIGDARTCKL